MGDWRNCVVTLIDVVGIKSLARSGPESSATTAMRRLHELTSRYMREAMPSHAHAYCWNDSVLLLGFLESNNAANLLREASSFRRAIHEEIRNCYAISVRGQAFPELETDVAVERRSTVVKASSYALANCFEIEHALREEKAIWCLDSRLQSAVKKESRKIAEVRLLPYGKARSILLFDEDLY
jgi:hypothetical protein